MARTNFYKRNDPFLPQSRVKQDQTSYDPILGKPRYCEERKLWLYGNERLLYGKKTLVKLPEAEYWSEGVLADIEREAEDLVLSGHTIVTGIHNEAHRRVAVVPLRWGTPRIVVFSGGFTYHLGKDLNTEPFRAARWWRYEWDPTTDLAVSKRAPSKLPAYAKQNRTVDRLVEAMANE